MTYDDFANELCLKHKVLAITRTKADQDATQAQTVLNGCTLAALNRALAGEHIRVTPDNITCRGSYAGFGFRDGIPNIPGGFGYFLSSGRGEGFPPGERIKNSPETAEAMVRAQPQNVMDGFAAIDIRRYEDGVTPDTVTALANPDQLAALIHVFNFENPDYDNVIAPMSSGCASVFRIPFGELTRGDNARAVIGGVDVFSRPHFPADTFFFTVPGTVFQKMLDNADHSMLASHIWKGVKKRLS